MAGSGTGSADGESSSCGKVPLARFSEDPLELDIPLLLRRPTPMLSQSRLGLLAKPLMYVGHSLPPVDPLFSPGVFGSGLVNVLRRQRAVLAVWSQRVFQKASVANSIRAVAQAIRKKRGLATRLGPAAPEPTGASPGQSVRASAPERLDLGGSLQQGFNLRFVFRSFGHSLVPERDIAGPVDDQRCRNGIDRAKNGIGSIASE